MAGRASQHRLQQTRENRGGRASPLAVLLMIGATAGLGVVTAAFGLGRLWAEDDPERALRAWPWQVQAHLALAASALSGAGESPKPSLAESHGRQALAHAPLSVRAVSVLGQAAVLKGEAQIADAMMQAAARRSLRDAPSQTWLFARALERRDYPAAMRALDVLLRRRPELIETLGPVLFPVLDAAPDARAALAERLALAPTWRSALLASYSRAAAQPGFVYALHQSLRDGPTPPTDQEAGAYINRLVRDRAYVAALVAWQQQRPRTDAGLMIDGGFEAENSLPPFGWRLTAADGGAADIIRSPAGEGRALQATALGGLKRQGLAEQLLVLAPGSYRLQGRLWREGKVSDGALVWTLRCENGPAIKTSQGPRASGEAGSPFSLTFTTPQGCPAQRLALETRPGASLSPTTVVYDDLKIELVGSR